MRLTLTGGRLPGRISPFQYGQFFEYLCSLVPSLYGEKLQDPGFEGIRPCLAHYLPEADPHDHPWQLRGDPARASFELDTSAPLAGASSGRLTIPTSGTRAAVRQDGIAVEAGARYQLSLFARAEDQVGPITTQLVDDGGTVMASVSLPAAGDHWALRSVTLSPEGMSRNASLEIGVSGVGGGSLWIDQISLMSTDAVSGWRPDVVETLRALRPGILRFGGTTIRKHFEWTDTVGPPERRQPFLDGGGSSQSGNVGIDEFLDLCDTIGVEPLMCVRFSDRQPADAAALVEYCNKTVGGPRPRRAPVRYWQIGNEVRGAEYEAGLPEFCRAMLDVDPNIHLMSSFPSAGVLAGSGRHLSHVCPHLYHAADLERAEADIASHLDLIRRAAPTPGQVRLAITEWNASNPDWGPGRGELMTLGNALACARFHHLMHRHADTIEIANRSNLADSFCGGAIETDNGRLYCRPVYYVQAMYAQLGGRWPLEIASAVDDGPGSTPDVSAAFSDDQDALVLHLVNDGSEPLTVDIDISRLGVTIVDGDGWQVSDGSAAPSQEAMNGFDTPDRVSSRPIPVRDAGLLQRYELPPLSCTGVKLALDRSPPVA